MRTPVHDGVASKSPFDSPMLRHLRDAKNDEEYTTVGLAWALRHKGTGRHHEYGHKEESDNEN